MKIKAFYLFRCSFTELYTVFVSALFLAAAQCRLLFESSEKILKHLQNPAEPERSALLDPLLNLRTTRLVSLLESVDRNFLWKPSCLRRAIALAAISRRLGMSPEFKLGVRQENESFEAHCWLELDGARLEMQGHGFTYSLLPSQGNG
jgi:hypothetical protein